MAAVGSSAARDPDHDAPFGAVGDDGGTACADRPREEVEQVGQARLGVGVLGQDVQGARQQQRLLRRQLVFGSARRRPAFLHRRGRLEVGCLERGSRAGFDHVVPIVHA